MHGSCFIIKANMYYHKINTDRFIVLGSSGNRTLLIHYLNLV